MHVLGVKSSVTNLLCCRSCVFLIIDRRAAHHCRFASFNTARQNSLASDGHFRRVF